MEQFKIQQNEAFFNQILNTLNEGGVYAFPSAGQVYFKRNGKLTGSAEALSHIKGIVSNEFFKKHFSIETTSTIKTN